MFFAHIRNKSFRFGFILFMVALNSSASKAQNKVIWQAAVVPNELKLYAQPSSSSRVATAAGVADTVILAMVEAPTPETKRAAVVTGFVESSKSIAGNNHPSAANPPSSPASSVSTPANLSIPAGSTVFIEPMKGFEIYLTAAIQKKKVPLVVVSAEEQAQFVITGDSDTKKAGWAKIIFMGNLHSDEEASVAMVNNKTGAVVFAYAVNKKNTLHGQQTSAEACAKHLKERIEGKE